MHIMQNLWPEFDNKQLQADSARRAQKHSVSQSRRPSEQAVLSTLRDWLLHDYLIPYCRSLAATRIFRRCYWIDGFGNSRISQLVHSASQELVKEIKPIFLHYIALEPKRSNRKVSSGEEVITIPKEGGSLRTSWHDAGPSLLQAIDQSAAFFSLSPFASSPPFTFEDLSPLYQRTAPTELCLLISQKQIESHLIPYLHTPDGALTFTALLRNDRWKSVLADSSEKFVVEKLTGAFFDSIQQQHFLTVQQIPLLMHTTPAVVEQVPYTLIYATRRQDSLLYMNDALCIYHRRLYEQSLEGVLAKAWFAAQQSERLSEGMQQLYQHVLQQGRSQRQRRWPDLRQQALLTHFGQFTLQDYDSVIQKLLQSGEVRCEWRQKPLEIPQSENQRIPGNDDILLW